MRIGEVAQASGVGVETVRFYEQKGLIGRPPRPSDGGYRSYPSEAVHRISFIRRAQDLGFALSEIAELLALEAGEDARCVDVRRRAENKREEVQARIDNLERIRGALEELIEACPGEGPARACSIIEAINRGDLHLRALPKEQSNERCQTED
jgi:Hg(II)-responsive transcriptional regulator